MTRPRRKVSTTKMISPSNEENSIPPTPPEPTGKVFLGEEDKRLLKKFNKHIINKLGIGGNRSVKM